MIIWAVLYLTDKGERTVLYKMYKMYAQNFRNNI